MAARGCTCGVEARDATGIAPIGGGRHYRDCASMLPDPDTCTHSNRVRNGGWLFCGACGKGMSEGGPAWVRDALAPGYAERLAESRAAAKVKEDARMAREATYDVSGIYLDYGITDLADDELKRLIDVCTRELTARE